MGVSVLRSSRGSVELVAPLAPNINHQGTVFGGSVAALASLAGWATIHSRLRDEGRNEQVVISRSTIHYEAPATGAIRAVSEAPGDEAWGALLEALERRGRGRIGVIVSIESEGVRVARFEGSYAAIPSES